MSELSFIEHTFEDQTEPNISSANLFQGNNLDSLFKNDSIFSGDYSLETRSKLQQLVESFEYIPGANGAKRLKLGQEDDEYPTDIDHIQGFDVSIDLKSSPNKMVTIRNLTSGSGCIF